MIYPWIAFHSFVLGNARFEGVRLQRVASVESAVAGLGAKVGSGHCEFPCSTIEDFCRGVITRP
jgi:hypothetical protein